MSGAAAAVAAPRPAVRVEAPSDDRSCWQAAADSIKLSVHDDIGVEFTFVLPWRQEGFGAPAIVERARPPLGPLFIVADEADAEGVTRWLGVPQ
jgi:hypothetical protein